MPVLHTFLSKNFKNISQLHIFSYPLWSHRKLKVGNDLKDHLVSSFPAMGRDFFLYTRLFKAFSNLALNTARVGAPTTSLGNLFTLTIKNISISSPSQ